MGDAKHSISPSRLAALATIAASSMILLAAGCQNGASANACEPGSTRGCVYAGCSDGAQTCRDDGTYGECVCRVDTGGGAGAGGAKPQTDASVDGAGQATKDGAAGGAATDRFGAEAGGLRCAQSLCAHADHGVLQYSYICTGY